LIFKPSILYSRISEKMANLDEKKLMEEVQEDLKKQLNIAVDNVRRADITTELIEACTSKVHIVMSQVINIMDALEMQVKGQHEYIARRSVTTELHPAFPPVELRPENRIGISTLAQNIGHVMEGKFFLCRTITGPSQIIAIETAVEDPTGKEAIRISLYNFSTCEAATANYDNIMPCGTILAIKNPWFKPTAGGGLMVRCDNPSDVEVLSPKRMSRLFPDIAWQGVIPPYPFMHPLGDFWNFVSNTAEETVAERLKKLGNIAFIEQRFMDAVRWYDQCLDYSDEKTTDTEIFANRAAAFLNLRCYRRALADCESAIKKKPFHEKAVFRKTKALWGLKKYDEASQFICGKIENDPTLSENAAVKNLAITAQFMCKTSSENRGGVDIMKMLQIKEEVQFVDDVCEYTGPVTIRDVPKKGRGLVATEDIQPGQIVVISKAFALAKLKKNQEVEQLSLNLDTKRMNLPGHEALVAQIANRIYFEPESGEEFYNLFAGPELGTLGHEPWKVTSVDLKRIDRIVNLNSFSCTNKTDATKFGTNEGGGSVIGSAIWVLPSLINHSCLANCKWIPYGDVLIIRAFQLIKKGEEILIPYVSPTASFEERKKISSGHLFKCECKLCELDSKDEQDGTGNKREKILKKIKKHLESSSPLEMRKAVAEVSKLVTLRKLHPQLNCLVSTDLQKIAAKLFIMGRFQLCLEQLKMAYDISKGTSQVTETVMIAVNIIGCSLALGQVKSVKVWVQKVKEDLMVAYGSIEAMKVIGSRTVVELSAIGIDFFENENPI
jgi:tetratricopeptide (TPR) repeat protein